MNKPAILQVMSGRAIGGVEKLVVWLAEEQVRRGHRVVVACPPGSWTAHALSGSGVVVETIPMKGLAAKIFGRRRMREILRKYDIGLVHTHMKLDSILALPEASQAGIPSVCTMHMYGEELYCCMADACIAITNAVKSDLIGRGVPSDDVCVVLNGISTDNFTGNQGNFRDEHGFSKSDVLVGSVCRLIRRKGIDVLIRSIADCPETKLIIAGYGKPDYERSLRALAEELGVSDRTFFIGSLDNPASMIAALDIYALPSREEGLGITILEAMASGVPVVASAVGGVPEVIKNEETGLLVPPGHSDSLAEAIKKLTADRQLAGEVSSRARELVLERFKVSDMADGIESVYSRVISTR